jgi:MFS family permease
MSRAWQMVWILCLAGAISNIDRGILNLLVDPVRRDLLISDVQISLLQGLSFGLFYAIVGVPLGLIADRVPRRGLLLAGVAIWSAATLLGGLAPSYGWLFASRILVGLGEATLGPCALSLIGDLFPSDRRGRPISVHMLGGSLGGGLGVLMVGTITAVWPHAAWRHAFVIAGALGFIVVALLFLQPEPPRHGVVSAHPDRSPTLEAFRFLMRNLRVLLPFYLGFGFVAIAAWGTIAWTPSFIMRAFRVSAAEVGNALGTATLVTAVAGALLAGFLIDSPLGRGQRSSKFRLLIGAPLCYLPVTLVPFLPNRLAAISVSSLIYLLFPMMTALMLSTIADMVPNNLRGLSVSLLGLTSTLIGVVLGPFFVASVTEHLLHDANRVGFAIALVAAPALLIASALYTLALTGLRRSASRSAEPGPMLFAGSPP